MKKLEGILPATVSPNKEDGSFDAATMRRVVRHQLDAGSDGVYVCGGTGEGLLMSREDRAQALETVLDEVNGAATVIAHIGAFQTGETVALARHASDTGADAIAALPPAYFYVPDDDGMVEYYRTIADASDVPLLIYNIPQRTHITMTESLFTRLLEIPNVVGMKDSSGDIFSLGNLVANTDDPVIFEGEDATVLWALMAGANGGIGSTYNVMPHLYVNMWRAFQDGSTDAAVRTQLRINEIIAVLVRTSVISSVMKTMEFIGLPCGRPRSPNRALSDSESADLRAGLEAVGFFDEH